MTKPYPCLYCNQVCPRRWNLSVHIQRRHPGQFNPITEMKKAGLIEPHSCKLHGSTNKRDEVYSSAKTNYSTVANVSNIPKSRLSYLINMTRNPVRFENIVQEISLLKPNSFEVKVLILAINDLRNQS